MLKEEKLDYQDELEKYMEDNDVYEVFETMMKQLIIEQPNDPVPFLLDVLQAPQTKRIFIMGPPGSKRKEHILTLQADHFEDLKYETIWVGDLLNKEVIKKSDMGSRIAEAKKTYSYIDDEIVIDIVTKTIKQIEKEKKNWIIEGYPRTREQALSLTKMDFIPDRMILLEVADKLTEERVIENLQKEDAPKVTKDPAEIAKAVVQEYKTHIEGVKDIYSGNIAVIDGNKMQDVVLQEIARILKFKQANAPKTCPKILLIGLPGSGKTTQSRMLAEKLKVIHVEVNSIIKDVIRKNTDESKQLWKLLKEGDPIPDEIYEKLLSERLSQLDCRMNGFVLDGYPLTNDQMRFLLETCNIKPSHVISLDINDHRAYERLEYRKYDPVSGIYFNVYSDAPKDEEILKRLIQAPEDEHHVVKKIIMGLRKNLNIKDKIIINADNDPLSVHNDIMTEIGM